jgi:hypothetical protein
MQQDRTSRKLARRARMQEATARRREWLDAVKMSVSCGDCGWTPESREECHRLVFDPWEMTSSAGYPYIIPEHSITFRPAWSLERVKRVIRLSVPRCLPCHKHQTGAQRRGEEPRPARVSSATPPFLRAAYTWPPYPPPRATLSPSNPLTPPVPEEAHHGQSA